MALRGLLLDRLIEFPQASDTAVRSSKLGNYINGYF